MKNPILFLALFFPLCLLRAGAQDLPLVVHEWGTFTSLQDEDGNAIGGINTDDEPVPQFVRRLSQLILLNPSEAPPHFFQGAPACHPDVTMRLETPVIYFYPPAGWKAGAFDVHVSFQGGWLTEFYPAANFKAPGFDMKHPDAVYTEKSEKLQGFGGFGHIKKDAVGELSWNGLTLDAKAVGPETEEKVWLAPRGTKSTPLTTSDGKESEKFLFYRGVGHANASLRVMRDETGALQIHPQPGESAFHTNAAWVVDVLPDGKCAFKTIGKLDFDTDARPRFLQSTLLRAPIATIPGSFPPAEYAEGNMQRLQKEMREALVNQGLFADEADALLKTWEVSYFKSPGLRLFYLCPRADVDKILPLEISTPAHLTRVMVGRIEIVTPAQRAILAKIAAGPAPDLSGMRGVTGDSNSDFFKHPENIANFNDVMTGKKPYAALGLPIPEIYADYLKLG
ncbi:MAG: hypothetical protein WCD79_17105, partial [Chthoniobacteraceae bacterium]